MSGVRQNLINVCELIVDCEHKTAPTQETGYPSIRTPNIGRGRLILDGANRVSEKTYRTWSRRAIPQAEDLILAREAPIGNVAIIPKNLKVCLGQRTVLIRPDKSKVVPMFLAYLMLGDEIQEKLLAHSTGTTVGHLNMRDIRNLELPRLPRLPIQHKIAAILGNYDDLIENNTRRIKILEEMAGTIYREWFVEFRFSGHENVKMVESELGLIPHGWEIKRLGDVTSVITKGTTPTTLGKQFVNVGINFIKVESIDGQGGILENKLAKIDDETHGLLKRSQLRANDVLFSIAGAIGRVAIVPDRFLPANTNQALAIIRPSDLSLVSFLYQTLSSSTFLNYSLERVVQTAQANVSLSVLSSAPIIMPAKLVLTDFNRNLAPIIGLIDRLRAKNCSLRTTRDLLLPKLISGELDVSELDITTDGAQPRKDGTHIPSSLTEWLHSDEKILAGKPVIKGTRLAVEFIIELLENHWSEEDILGNYPNITREDIDACRAYQRKVLDAPVS